MQFFTLSDVHKEENRPGHGDHLMVRYMTILTDKLIHE